MKKIFLAFLMLFISGNALSFASGDGSAGNPYHIATWADLNSVRNDLTANYVLDNNLGTGDAGYDTYASSSANGGIGWMPIGSSSSKFSGTFDGNYYIITGIYLNRNGTLTYQGFFGYTSGTVQNLGLEDINVTLTGQSGYSYVGGLTGSNSGTITNTYTTGVLYSSGWYVGGLVGTNEEGIVSQSYSTVNVSSAAPRLGGLVGENDGGAVINSYATGTVTCSSNQVGGLVGIQLEDDCRYTSGGCNVSGGTRVETSYSTGSATGGVAIGGLVGSLSSGSCPNSFWDTQTSGNATSDCGTGKTTTQMKTESTFTNAGWDFSTVWDLISGTNNGYPFLPSITNSSATPSFSISTSIINIDGNAFSGDISQFSYKSDGNLTIDFNVLDTNSGAIITADLNYSSSNTQGTGTAIITGLSLDATVCDDANFMDSTACSYDLNISSSLIPSDGNYYILISVTDGGQSDFNYSSKTFMIDNSAPQTVLDYNSGWQNIDANITATATDSNSGVLITQYKLDTDSSSSVSLGSWTTLDFNILISTDGNWAIDFNSTDNTGNVEDTNRIYVLIDQTAPSISADNNSFQNVDANIQLSCTDSLSGCANSYFRVDSDPTSAVSYGTWQAYDANIFISSDGNYALDYNALDNAGNYSSTTTKYIVIDAVAPEISISAPTEGLEASAGSVSLEYSGSDSNSGIQKYYVSSDGSTWTDNSTNTSYTFSDQSAGTHTYYARAMDNAGNTADANVTITLTATSQGYVGPAIVNTGSVARSTAVITPGKTQTINYAAEDSIVVAIKLTAETIISAAVIDKKEIAKLETNNLPGKVYKYVELKFNQQEKLKDAEIEFKVEKSWLEEQKAGKNEIVLMRLVNGKWTELETTLEKTTGTHYYYIAKTPGFSYFAISIKDEINQEPATEIKENPEENSKIQNHETNEQTAEENETQLPIVQNKPEEGPNIFPISIAILTIITVAIAIMANKRTNKDIEGKKTI